MRRTVGSTEPATPMKEHPVQNVSLTALAREQSALAQDSAHGRSAHTVYGGRDHGLRQTVIALAAGQVLEEHANPGEATVHVLQGRVRLCAGEAAWEGSAGDLLIIPEARHSLEALEAAVVLLTVALRG
ncbi:MAG: Cupin 2 conserved barrel domain protein [Frankiales bacterium]|nr:Cupin 2 conserved barrel domain protein [Frankiales bacterium]